MSAVDPFAGMHAALFGPFGVPATVQRGAAEPVAVRVVVSYATPRYGEYGQVIGTSTTLDFLRAQWRPEQGDVVTWTDHLGTQTRTVASPLEDDGHVAKAVMRG